MHECVLNTILISSCAPSKTDVIQNDSHQPNNISITDNLLNRSVFHHAHKDTKLLESQIDILLCYPMKLNRTKNVIKIIIMG